MLSTLLLLLLAAFMLCYLASGQAKTAPVGYQLLLVRHARYARLAGGLLLAGTAAAFGLQFGWMAGLCYWLVGLMGIWGLALALAPFRYLGVASVALLYAVSLGIELLF